MARVAAARRVLHGFVGHAFEIGAAAHDLRGDAQHVDEVVEVAVRVQRLQGAGQRQVVLAREPRQRGWAQRAGHVEMQVDLGKSSNTGK
ncbi:hypothetical protein D9M72_561320 [compost metagenome]